MRAVVLLAWAAAFAGSFAVWALMPAEGDGFTRGLDRAMAFLGLQGLATLLAVAVWLLGNRLQPGPQKLLFRAPLILAGALVLIGGAATYLAVQRAGDEQQPPGPPKQVTAPPT